MRICAILPIKAESERVPNKNFRLINGIPLYERMLRKLEAVKMIDEIVVDTDSAELLSTLPLGKARGKERVPELLGHRVPMTDIIRHECDRNDADLFVQVHSTSPFLSVEAIERSIDQFVSGNCDSVFGVNRLQSRLYTADLKPINHDPSILLPTQELPVVLEENSSIYVFGRDLGRQGRRIGDNPSTIVVPPFEAFDIDTEDDWLLATRMAGAS